MIRKILTTLLAVPALMMGCAVSEESLDGGANTLTGSELRSPIGNVPIAKEDKPVIRSGQILISAESQTAFVDLRFVDRTYHEKSFGIGLLYSDNCPSSLGGFWGIAEHFNGFSTPGYGQIVSTKSPTLLFSTWTDDDGNVWQVFGYAAMIDAECEIRAVVGPSNCGLDLGGDDGDVNCEDTYGEAFVSEPVLWERVYVD